MRNLIILSACCFVIATAGAKDPPASPAGASAAATPAATKPAAAAPAPAPAASKAVAPAPAKPAARPLSAAEQRVIEEQAELDLQARIAARIAEMRANQQQRAAAAAKARKVTETKKKKDVVAVKPPPPANSTHWAYDGEFGPANWSKINSKWSQCGTGGRQSPIDIRDGMKVELEKLAFDYKPSSFSVIDNGHTIQVNVAGGNYLTVQNRSYELVQFHFHRPSEERINGKSFEMVVHLVHRDVEGKLAVLAVLLERGAAHSMIQTVWNNLPLEKHDTVQPSVVLDVAEVLPERGDYYTYMGSMTTPPCTEGVLWLVMKQPMQASPQQMAVFSRLYPFNARPVQANSGRVIKESN
ncbi:carbonic anhydrase family protein [Massilia sp. RP-1-19]|uniref:carbonic anhydrase n=1 Tax=Massilia polaris TaxID=2728846 RepID=A0A848HJ88_9BURK|nr:carbonic anhydrase family protein [Massilia polaris]NML61107.1 carbonic anhydrase family protein [Massilia polaris]